MPSEIRPNPKWGWADLRKAGIVLLFIFVSAGLSIQAFSRPRTEIIPARVVAYSSFPICLNDNVHWSMIIRVQRPKKSGSKFALVQFSLPCEKSPQFDSTNSKAQKFHLVRKEGCDEVLTGTTDIENVWKGTGEIQPGGIQEFKMQTFWRSLPGTEPEALPFGQVIPCYSSKDWPKVPVL